jgi:hypothetical protein
MTKIKKIRTLEENLLLLRQANGTSLTLSEILHVLSGKGRLLILLLLSLPFCQPIQIPGLSTPFGLGIAFMGLRMVFGKHIWLPKNLLSKNISKDTLSKIVDKTLVLLNKIKPWIHPRLYWLCHSSFMESVHGLTICVIGIFLALPLPIPLSNLTAAWSIFLLSLGILEDDGLFILIGYVASLITIALFMTIILTIKHLF